MPTSLPTSVRGAVSDELYSTVLYDALEQVPELQPGYQALMVYSQMAKDPTLSAIISSYVLQILRASWSVDGTGCRPEAVQMVADDLGLPVDGVDKPTAARVRGVSWPEHLRSALLSLTYGHYGHELQAELVDGKARLVGLWDRAPWTVNQIHVDPKTGSFLGITQDGAKGTVKDVPQIKADRMAWYTHDKVGANHFGQSLLRPGYGVHLIKREVIRYTATAHRRFSMGVPVVEWAQGMTTLTPGQISEAQQVASAARVGETAGASLPPGATLKLVGLSGGVPDNMALLRWLDTQLSRFALMPHIELGQNQAGGSRALGESFIDSWMLALAAIGSAIADQTTRQVAARIVEWNYGTDEPVPAVKVSGIGENFEVTADALQKLLASGALDTDPALQAWVRRKYHLPQRDPNAPVQTATKGAPGQPVQDNGQPADPNADPNSPGQTAADLPPDVAARQGDLDWGLFGGGTQPTSDQPTLFDDQDDVDLKAFSPV